MKKTLILIMVFCLMGCMGLKSKSPTSITYNTFKSFEIAYIHGMGTAGDLYKQGKITDAQKDEIIALGWKFKTAYEAAATAFRISVERPSLSNETEMDRLLDDARKIQSDFKRWIYERQ